RRAATAQAVSGSASLRRTPVRQHGEGSLPPRADAPGFAISGANIPPPVPLTLIEPRVRAAATAGGCWTTRPSGGYGEARRPAPPAPPPPPREGGGESPPPRVARPGPPPPRRGGRMDTGRPGRRPAGVRPPGGPVLGPAVPLVVPPDSRPAHGRRPGPGDVPQ